MDILVIFSDNELMPDDVACNDKFNLGMTKAADEMIANKSVTCWHYSCRWKVNSFKFERVMAKEMVMDSSFSPAKKILRRSDEAYSTRIDVDADDDESGAPRFEKYILCLHQYNFSSPLQAARVASH